MMMIIIIIIIVIIIIIIIYDRLILSYKFAVTDVCSVN
jgi:hypothetical protein